MSDLLPSSTANTLTNPTGLSLLLAKPTIFSHETIVPIIGAVQTVTGCLISHLLCLDRTFINVPAGLHMAGTMVAILAAPFVTEARQRSAGMLLGILLSTAGCLLSAAAVWRGDFLLYCAAAIPAGLSNGVLHSLRSAATRRVASSGHAWLPAMGLATGLMAAVAAPHLGSVRARAKDAGMSNISINPTVERLRSVIPRLVYASKCQNSLRWRQT